MTRDDIIRKCKGLLALSKSGNEAQMMAAAEKLFAWMAKYAIDMSEIEDKDNPGEGLQDSGEDGKYNESWRRTCYAAAAKMFMCQYYFVPIGTKSVGVVHHLVGQPHNVAVAAEIAKYFESTINRLANEAVRTQAIDKDEHTNRHRFIRTFRVACANRVFARVNEYVAQAKSGTLIDPESGTTLPAMLSLYEQMEAAYEAWKEAKGIKMTTHKDRDQNLSAAGRSLGRKAGDSISLNTQIGSRSSSFALPSG